ncbi:MAG: PQQ-binding-like beta-propeller repeat protein [Bradymonadia bacterium]
MRSFFSGIVALLTLGCAPLGGPGTQLPLAGLRPAAEQSAPTSLLWFKNIRNVQAHSDDQKTDRQVELGQPAYLKGEGVLWAGTAQGALKKLSIAGGQLLSKVDVGGVRSRIAHDGKLLYMGADDGRLIAVDAYNGEKVWSYKVRGVVSSAPTLGKKHVLVTDGTNAIYCLSKSGKWVWQYRREKPRHFASHGESRPLIHRGVVYQGFSDGYVVALRLDDGSLIWSANLGKEAGDRLDVDAGLVPGVPNLIYAASLGGGLYALQAATGKQKWRMKIKGITGLSGHDGDLLAATSDGRILRIDTFKRRIRWETALPTKKGALFEPTVVFEKYLVVGQSQGAMYWLTVGTGQPVRRFDPGAGFSTRPTFANDTLYALDNAGTLFAFGSSGYFKDQRATPLAD